MATARRHNRYNRNNLRLRDALTEARWTGQQLATAVNTAGAEAGLRLSYDRTAVAHWLSGTQPRQPVPDLLVEVLSRRLGRQVTAAGLWLVPEADGNVAQQTNHDASSMLTSLHAASRWPASTVPTYSLAALMIPGWAESGPIPVRHKQDAGTPATLADTEAAEHLIRILSVGDATFGGGHVRRATAAYLAANLASKLYTPMPALTRRRLFTAATQMTYLCGFMCFDEELHGLSQRYYQTALRLAAENGDRSGYVTSLRALSVQAESLGHHLHARTLAETAVSSSRQLGPTQQAFVHGQLAVTQAADGDRSGALLSLAAAERRLDQATSAVPVIGAYHVASLTHQQAAVRALLGDRRGAIGSLRFSIRHRPAGERRARAITRALLAELELSTGRLDEAIETWHRFLDDYAHLDSGRATSALRKLRARIRPHTKNLAARAVLQRASVALRS